MKTWVHDLGCFLCRGLVNDEPCIVYDPRYPFRRCICPHPAGEEKE